MVRRKDFPALKIGKRFYIIENKVDEWLNKQAEKFWCQNYMTKNKGRDIPFLYLFNFKLL